MIRGTKASARNVSHRHAAIHVTGRSPCRRHAAADRTIQQSGATSDQQRRVSAYLIWGRPPANACI